jgi:hypothetical protein
MPYKIKVTKENDTYYATYNNIKHKMEESDIHEEHYTEFVMNDGSILAVFYHTPKHGGGKSFCEIKQPNGSWYSTKSSFNIQ